MAKLNQIIAVEASVKNQAQGRLTEAYQLLQKSAPLSGISRTYQPNSDDGERLPSESTLVQVKTEQVIDSVLASLTEEWDVTATKDWANCLARADVVVGAVTLLKDVPVTYLLYLEKELTDLHTFIAKLPVLDAAETWQYDQNRGVYATAPVETTRTKKVPKVLIRYEATKEHPAQTEVYQEDVSVGRWTTIKFSGALPADRQRELLDRVEALQKAVKVSREAANMLEVAPIKVGSAVFSWLFAPNGSV